MKRFVKLLVIGALMFAGVACEQPNDKEQPEPQLEATPNNIAGSWELTLWNNGEKMPEGSFVYLDFERADRTYTIYQNIDSFGTRTITGRYYIYVDEELGSAVLRGDYAHGAGEWNHRYIIRSLTASQMILVAKDNPEDVCLYDRKDIPTEIRGEE